MPSTQFGLIGDVAADGRGRLYVLDVGQKRIAVVEGGEVRSWMGAPGRGPGELLDPVSLAVSPDGHLHLVDRGNQRILAYGIAVAPVTVPLDFVPEDACFTAEGRLFVLGARDGYLLHEVSVDERRVVRSLLYSAASRESLLRPYHASGFVHCGADGEMTVLPLLRAEVVRIRDAAAARLIPIPGFRETRIRRMHAGAVVYEGPRGGKTDYASSLVPLGDGRLLVQIGPVLQGATGHEFESLRSFLLSVDARTLAELGTGLPRVMAITGDSAFAVQTDPVPALHRLSLQALGIAPHDVAAAHRSADSTR